jgi:hypothetical protein
MPAPVGDRADERILQRLFGKLEVAGVADEPREDSGSMDAKRSPDRLAREVRAHAASSTAFTGRTSTDLEAFLIGRLHQRQLVTSFLRETQRLRIGQLVTGNNYRNRALQAKMASTADVIGNGRLTFGIGAGWYEADYLTSDHPVPVDGGRDDLRGQVLQRPPRDQPAQGRADAAHRRRLAREVIEDARVLDAEEDERFGDRRGTATSSVRLQVVRG